MTKIDGRAMELLLATATQAAKAEPKPLVIDGHTYVNQKLERVAEPNEPEASKIVVSTLDAFVQYLKSEIDREHRQQVESFVKIENPKTVRLVSAIFGKNKQREVIIEAVFGHETFPFGRYMNQEEFVIALLTGFEGSQFRDDLVAVASNVTTGAAQTLVDDGVSQEVTVKTSKTLVGKAILPKFINLKPYRTFPDIHPVETPFLFRVRKDEDDSEPRFTLIEADGGKWYPETMTRINEFLSNADTGYLIIG